jgi:hypothetical protein
LMLDGSIH